MRALDVLLRDRHVGRLVELERGGDYSFEYDPPIARIEQLRAAREARPRLCGRGAAAP